MAATVRMVKNTVESRTLSVHGTCTGKWLDDLMVHRDKQSRFPGVSIRPHNGGSVEFTRRPGGTAHVPLMYRSWYR
jgi:hypothetical protein